MRVTECDQTLARYTAPTTDPDMGFLCVVMQIPYATDISTLTIRARNGM